MSELMGILQYGSVVSLSALGLAGLLFVPSLQHRFVATFSTLRRGERIAVAAAAAAVVAGALLVSGFSPPGEPDQPVFAVFVTAAITYWAALAALVASRLWVHGQAQPMATRLRRTLVVGSLGLAVAVVVSGVESLTDVRPASTVLRQALTLLSGAALLVAFAPPPSVRAWWRHRDWPRHLQLAPALMDATTPADVAGPCVAYASRLFGGRGAVMVDAGGRLLAAHGLQTEEARRLAEIAANGGGPDTEAAQLLVRTPCGNGWLAVQTSAYTSFIGGAEADELRGVGALANLALHRVVLHEQLRSSRQQLAQAQSLARVGSWEWDATTDRVWWSDELFRLHGLPPAATTLCYADVIATVHPDDRELVETTLRDALERGEPFSVEHRVVHPDGTVLRLHTRGGVPARGSGERGRMLGATQDITEQRGLEAAVAHGALHDPLTELANRMLFTERLSRALAHGERHDRLMAVLLLDLDDFAAVNDTLGPLGGDEVLRVVANRLQGLARPVDTVARLGADQFGILLESTDMAATTALTQRIRSQLARPLAVPGGQIVVRGSIGITIGANSVSAGEYLRNADAAMRAAKLAGKDGYRIFENGMHAELSRRAALRADLQQAVAGDQLWLAFQPVVSLTDGAVVAVEALVRWDHPEHGPVSPEEFIPIAEDSGLIVPIGQWVLHEAVAQVCAWRDQCPQMGGLGLHVNVSARELKQATLVEGFAAVLEASRLEPELLTVEITESVLMAETDASVVALEALRRLGVRVAIDDFGTGYSSLSYLRRLPVDTLKIDKAFVDGVAFGPEDAALARAIVKIGQALRLSVVAEGVETAAQAARLRAMGCAAAQGYHFSRPLPAHELLALLVAAVDDTNSAVDCAGAP